jgi:hypothetical protein
MRAAELLAFLRGVVARLALGGRRQALACPFVACGVDGIDVGLGGRPREESRGRVATRAVVVGGLLVDNDRSKRLADAEPLSARGTRPGVAGRDRRLFTDGREVIVSATCSSQFILTITEVSRVSACS